MAIDPNAIAPLLFDELPILDLVKAMGKAVAASDLQAWSTVNYGQGVTVFCGTDPDDAPNQENYPLVEIFPLDSNHGREIARHERSVGVTMGLFDEELAPLEQAAGFTMQQAIIKREEMITKVMTVLATVDLQGGYIAQVEIVRSEEDLYPSYMAGANLLIVKPI